VSDRRDIVHAAARDVIAAYRRANPIQTADFHGSSCSCLRCAVDNLEAALAHEAATPNTPDMEAKNA
jgi:hypothetical protein